MVVCRCQDRGYGAACREWCTTRTSPIAASASSTAVKRVRNAVTACAFLVPWWPARERRRAAVDSDAVPAGHPQMNSGTSRARRLLPRGWASCAAPAQRPPAEGHLMLGDQNRCPTHCFDDMLRVFDDIRCLGRCCRYSEFRAFSLWRYGRLIVARVR